LDTIQKINDAGDLEIRTDSGRSIAFNICEHPHLDHGYAVTSHSRQGQTADRVLVHVGTEKSERLVNNRFEYMSVSRGQYDAQIYTDNRSELAREESGRLLLGTASRAARAGANQKFASCTAAPASASPGRFVHPATWVVSLMPIHRLVEHGGRTQAAARGRVPTTRRDAFTTRKTDTRETHPQA